MWRSRALREGYESVLANLILPESGNVALAAITTMRVKGWVADLTRRGLSSSRVRQAYQLLSMILKAAVESEYLVKSPCVGVRIARLPKRD